MLSYTNAGVAAISEERKAKYLTYDPNVWIADLMGQVNGLLDAAEDGKHMAACLQMLANVDPNCGQQAIAVVQEAKFRLILFSRAVIMSHVVRSVLQASACASLRQVLAGPSCNHQPGVLWCSSSSGNQISCAQLANVLRQGEGSLNGCGAW